MVSTGYLYWNKLAETRHKLLAPTRLTNIRVLDVRGLDVQGSGFSNVRGSDVRGFWTFLPFLVTFQKCLQIGKIVFLSFLDTLQKCL